MNNTTDPVDVIEIAVRIERNAIDFYKNLYENSTNADVREISSFMVSEEEKHLGTFNMLLEKNADYMIRFKYPGMYEDFLKDAAFLAVEEFTDADSVKAVSKDEILKKAEDIEKSTIKYYSKMMESFPEKAMHYLKEIIAEENGHLKKISALRKKTDPS
ncbi:MAG: ferritin-like domain-containing protein [Fibrobacterota bacterium]